MPLCMAGIFVPERQMAPASREESGRRWTCPKTGRLHCDTMQTEVHQKKRGCPQTVLVRYADGSGL